MYDAYMRSGEFSYRQTAVGLALVGTLALAGCSTESEPASEINQPVTTTEQIAGPEQYMNHENIMTTVFWIGEAADASNGFISNVPTAWDGDASARYGGYDGSTAPDSSVSDTPRDELGIPLGFQPLHNPYYFALPAAEFNESGLIPGAREQSPWASETVADDESLFKGRWIKITNGDKTVFAQWLDVGPNETDDYGYVFGNERPKNTFGLDAGLDVSPATAKALGFDDGGIAVSWSFVKPEDVADGPWKKYPPIDNKTHWD